MKRKLLSLLLLIAPIAPAQSETAAEKWWAGQEPPAERIRAAVNAYVVCMQFAPDLPVCADAERRLNAVIIAESKSPAQRSEAAYAAYAQCTWTAPNQKDCEPAYQELNAAIAAELRAAMGDFIPKLNTVTEEFNAYTACRQHRRWWQLWRRCHLR
jgi:hypothetical protein